MRISDWSSDVCSSDLLDGRISLADVAGNGPLLMRRFEGQVAIVTGAGRAGGIGAAIARRLASEGARVAVVDLCRQRPEVPRERFGEWESLRAVAAALGEVGEPGLALRRSEEHTSELQSLMRISYAVFCLNKKKNQTNKQHI